MQKRTPPNGEVLPSGFLEIPLSSFPSEMPPFAQPQTADPSVCYADISPNRGVSSGKAFLRGHLSAAIKKSSTKW